MITVCEQIQSDLSPFESATIKVYTNNILWTGDQMILHRGYRDDPELQHTSVVFSQRRLHRLQTSRISLHVTGTYAAVTVLCLIQTRLSVCFHFFCFRLLHVRSSHRVTAGLGSDRLRLIKKYWKPSESGELLLAGIICWCFCSLIHPDGWVKSCSTRFDLLNETETETISGVATNQRPEQTRVMDVTRETEDTNKILSVGSARFELLIFITGRGRLSLSLFLSRPLSPSFIPRLQFQIQQSDTCVSSIW